LKAQNKHIEQLRKEARTIERAKATPLSIGRALDNFVTKKDYHSLLLGFSALVTVLEGKGVLTRQDIDKAAQENVSAKYISICPSCVNFISEACNITNPEPRLLSDDYPLVTGNRAMVVIKCPDWAGKGGD